MRQSARQAKALEMVGSLPWIFSLKTGGEAIIDFDFNFSCIVCDLFHLTYVSLEVMLTML